MSASIRRLKRSAISPSFRQHHFTAVFAEEIRADALLQPFICRLTPMACGRDGRRLTVAPNRPLARASHRVEIEFVGS